MKIVKYNLTNRGLFSEINNMINGYIWAKRRGYGFVVNSSESRLYFSQGFTYFFKTIDDDHIKPQHVFLVEGVRCPNFRAIRSEKISFETKRKVTRSILEYTDHVRTKINHRIEDANLPSSYCVLHIRRGDKVNEKPTRHEAESKRFEVDEYFSKLPRTMGLTDIFVMTDNYAVIGEINEYVSLNSLNTKIHHFCDSTMDGHATNDRMKKNNFFNSSEVINLLAECEIAKNSEYFICTFSSNVGRYIKLIHKKPENCISLDSKWQYY